MKRTKKLIVITVITVLVLGGVLGGFAIANADEPTTTTTGPVSANISNLLDRVATIYQQETNETLNTQALTDAFQKAQQDIRTEALNNYIDKLVTEGKLDSDQAQQYKDWLSKKPDVNIPGLNPPLGPGPNGGRAFMGKFGGRLGGMFRGWCGPGATTTPDTTNQ
jgi:hypothetical protein